MESSSSLLIFRTALPSLLSQGAEHCSLDTQSTSGCDPCLRNHSSHNRPFPMHTTQGCVQTHSSLYNWIASAEEMACSREGMQAQRLILLFRIFCMWCKGDEMLRLPMGGFHCVTRDRWRRWRVQINKANPFPSLNVLIPPAAVWNIKIIWEKGSFWYLGCLTIVGNETNTSKPPSHSHHPLFSCMTYKIYQEICIVHQLLLHTGLSRHCRDVTAAAHL